MSSITYSEPIITIFVSQRNGKKAKHTYMDGVKHMIYQKYVPI